MACWMRGGTVLRANDGIRAFENYKRPPLTEEEQEAREKRLVRRRRCKARNLRRRKRVHKKMHDRVMWETLLNVRKNPLFSE
jgi:hypothetical protein